MNKTTEILSALAIIALAIVFSAPGLMAADEEKPKVRHPSYTLLGHDPPPEDSPLNPNFVIAQESRIVEGTLWHGSYINERLVGLDVADADGDGKNELVYATLNNVYFARRSGDVLEQLATFNVPSTQKILSIDFYDTDGDGRHEIILSCQQDGSGASSYVLSFSGQKELQVLGAYIPWYMRVFGGPGNRTLAVQKSATGSSSAYSGAVYFASFKDGKVTTSQKVDVPFGINLYNFNMGKLGPSGQNVIAAVKFPDEHLRLYSGNRRDDIITESAFEYCGTINYINIKTSVDVGKDVEYLPSRIIFADLDNDGANEVIVAKNNQGGIPFMKNMRAFNGGVIEAMKFSNLSLVPFFSSTNLLPGPAVDYQLADFDNNGTRDLVVGVIIAPGSGMLQQGRSVIISYSNLYTPLQPSQATASK
ncbi:MAG: FG-GAP-like repeat-containing protein [Deltaproteobacteria bacterium]|nr:FG-GAP-like repeat-containing protein [Deltaproteobacteria bacterium]